MDHICLPQDAYRRHIRVPYLGGGDCDDGPFETYPERVGYTASENWKPSFWSWEALKDGLHYVNDPVDFTDKERAQGKKIVFLQTWLYFGTLKAILGPLYEMNNFLISTSDNSMYITTTRLPEYISLWVDLQRSGEKSNTRIEKTRMYTILKLVLFQIYVVSGCENFALVDRIVVFSITVLQEALYSAWQQAFDLLDEFSVLIFKPLKDGRDFLAWTMLRDGWCFHEIKSTLDFPPSLRYVAAFMKRPGAEKEHLRCFKESRCIAYDKTAYETKHSRTDCRCHHVRTDEDQVYNLLKNGSIALIAPMENPWTHASTASLIEGKQDTTYVAISHVWSEGLGNEKQNSLPLCQLEKLNGLVQNLYASDPCKSVTVPFWIDTLCCPVNPRRGRNLAIKAMGRIYKNAHKVLVLDSYLQDFEPNASPSGRSEILLKLFLSQWTKRLWTFQEGALAQNLYFQCRTGAVHIWEILVSINKIKNCTGLPIRLFDFCTALHPHQVLVGLVDNLPPSETAFKTQEKNYFRTFYLIVNELRTRQTTKQDDEAICLATLLNLEMDKILMVPPNQRMRCFWELQPFYSRHILVLNRPTLSDEGFRWAPASFLQESEPPTEYTVYLENRKLRTEEIAQRTMTGLVVTFQGILISKCMQKWDANGFILEDGSGARYLVLAQKQPLSLDAIGSDGQWSFALMLQHFANQANLCDGAIGFLVYIRGREKETLLARRGPPVIIVPKLTIHDDLRTISIPELGNSKGEEFPYDMFSRFKSTWTPENQKWCFD